MSRQCEGTRAFQRLKADGVRFPKILTLAQRDPVTKVESIFYFVDEYFFEFSDYTSEQIDDFNLFLDGLNSGFIEPVS